MNEVKRFRFVDTNGYPALRVCDSLKAERFVEEEEYDRVKGELSAALLRENALTRELEAESQGADRAAESLMEWRRDYMALQKRVIELEANQPSDTVNKPTTINYSSLDAEDRLAVCRGECTKDEAAKNLLIKNLLRKVRATLHFTPEDVLAIDAALRDDGK